MLGNREIVTRFAEMNLNVHPDVVKYIRESQDEALISQIAARVPKSDMVATLAHLPGPKAEKDGTRILEGSEVEVLQGTADFSHSNVDFRDFIHFFRDRYDKLSANLHTGGGTMPIEALTGTSRYRDQECTIKGMVGDIRNTGKGHRMAGLEDPTSTINVLFNKSREVFADAERLVPDEVIGVKGKLSSDGNLFFANTLKRPDIPLNNAPYMSKTPGKAVLISDVHVGSDTFLHEEWERFSDWLQDADVQYLLIAGDVVDGIGIYPGQEKELVIKNIYEQYDAFGEMLKKLPARLQIVISPGNHDAVRMAEPQPALPDIFTSKFPDNVILVENPALVSLQGVRVLMYHGKSFDDLISMIPGASYEHPEEMMVEMLKRRELTCTYGMRTPIYPQKKDRLIIDPIPEILLTGHVHICGITQYRGVLAVNTGTWQSQTGFQKQMNINPTPARATVVDLQTLIPQIIDFSRTE